MKLLKNSILVVLVLLVSTIVFAQDRKLTEE